MPSASIPFLDTGAHVKADAAEILPRDACANHTMLALISDAGSMRCVKLMFELAKDPADVQITSLMEILILNVRYLCLNQYQEKQFSIH